MSQINKKLESWASQGLISKTQYDSILSYESSLPKTNWTMMGVILLAIGTISLGIISLIAYNWHLIPNAVKLSTGFAILFATGFAITRSRARHSLVIKDGLIAFFILFCFAMIGLIAQIYNVKGDDYQTGLLWSAMTVALVSTASHFLISYLWTSVFTVSLMAAFWSYPPLKDSLSAPFLAFVLLSGLLCLITRPLFGKSHLYTAYKNTVVFFWILAALIFSLGASNAPNSSDGIHKILPHLGLALLLVLVLFFSKPIRRIYKQMGSLILVLLLLGTSTELGILPFPILASIFSIISFMAWAIVFFAADYKRMYHLMFVLTAVKIFEIFVREAESLLATGLGLILAGSIVMLAVYGWNRKKDVLERRLQEFIQ